MQFTHTLFIISFIIFCLSSCGTLREYYLPEEENSLSGAGSLVTKSSNKAKSFEILDIDKLLKEYGFGTIGTDNTFEWNTDVAKKSDNIEYIYRRNELQDRIISASNQRCGYYIRTLVSSKSFTQVNWGSLSILLSGAATVVKPVTTAKGLAAGGAVSSGILSTYNEAYFNNLALNVISSGITRQRQAQLEKILEMKKKPLTEYSVNQAIGDALNYHAACNMISGLETAAIATKTTSTEKLLDPGKTESSANNSSAASVSSNSSAPTQVQINSSKSNSSASLGFKSVSSTNASASSKSP